MPELSSLRLQSRYLNAGPNGSQATGEQLDSSLVKVTTSQIKELQRFAKGLERDKAAVLVGLIRSQSNVQTEGQINKLKLIKPSVRPLPSGLSFIHI